MRLLPIAVLLASLAAAVPAAEEKPFMSFDNPPAAPIPREEHRTYESAAMKTRGGYNIYLPPGYGDPGNTNRYPVIYWLHGRGCSESNDQFPPEVVEAMHATLNELNLTHEYAEIPGIKHDLPGLSEWLGNRGLEFAARHFAPANGPAGP